jgi:hypothetical protein
VNLIDNNEELLYIKINSIKLKLLEFLNIGFLLIIISIGLFNADFFYSPTAFAYYGFCIVVLFFTIFTFTFSVKSKPNFLKIPQLLFCFWCLYILVLYITNSSTLVFTIYSLLLCFLLIKASSIFSVSNFDFNILFIVIAGIASVESFYCIGQFLGWFKSQNELFRVTGSW